MWTLCPVKRLQTALERRQDLDACLGPSLSPTTEQQQWRSVVRGQLFDPLADLWQPRGTHPLAHEACMWGEGFT